MVLKSASAYDVLDGMDVRRASCCINHVSHLVIPGPRGPRGRLRKTWSECVKNDLSAHNLIDVNLSPGQRELASKDQRQPGVANPGCRDNGSTLNTKTGW